MLPRCTLALCIVNPYPGRVNCYPVHAIAPLSYTLPSRAFRTSTVYVNSNCPDCWPTQGPRSEPLGPRSRKACRILILPAPLPVCCLVRVPTAVAPVVLLKLGLVLPAVVLWLLCRHGYGTGLSPAHRGVLGLVAGAAVFRAMSSPESTRLGTIPVRSWASKNTWTWG